MHSNVRICSTAWRSIEKIATYLAENASLVTARRFVTSFKNSIATIQRMPQIGSTLVTAQHELDGIRCWTLSKPFQKYVVFYRLKDDNIEIVDVLHGSQDYESKFET